MDTYLDIGEITIFTDNERDELVSRLLMVLEQQKAGQATVRKELAELLTDTTREFLKGKYSTNLMKDLKIGGIHQTRDSLSKDDFGPAK